MLDSHQHFWQVARGDYHWMEGAGEVLQRDYLPADLAPQLRKAGVTRTILIQAAETVAETEFLLELAAQTDFIAGVTGWLDMSSAEFPARLEQFNQHPKFIAIRPMLQDIKQDNWILQPQVLANLSYLAETGFPFEFLTYPRHLPYVLEALEKTPGLHAVVDHISKPDIASGAWEPWADAMEEVATYPNIYCKLSGMVTEADHEQWSPEDLSPYIKHVVTAFGTDRVMFGSDWPVCRLAAEYAEVVLALRTILDNWVNPQELQKIFQQNAERFYGLEIP